MRHTILHGVALASLCLLARVFAAGGDPIWGRRYPWGNVTTTPTYPWQRERAWLDLSSRVDGADASPTMHPLLGHHVEDPVSEPEPAGQMHHKGQPGAHLGLRRAPQGLLLPRREVG